MGWVFFAILGAVAMIICIAIALAFLLSSAATKQEKEKNKREKENPELNRKIIENSLYSGTELERETFYSIYRKLDEGDRLITNLLIPIDSERKTEVDAIIVSRKGIYVLEIKDMSGFVRGSDDDEYWTQINDYHRLSFKNPIEQNERHCKAVDRLLNYGYEISNVVLFTLLEDQEIESWGKLCFSITGFINAMYECEDIIPKNEVERISNTLFAYKATNKQMHNHIVQIKN